MDLIDAIRNRRTTNGPFKLEPVSKAHQHLLIEAASRAPSHFNSQPWRFILIEDPTIRQKIAAIGGRTMTQLFAEGRFFRRYRKYFRFSQQEMEEKQDGIYIDTMPAPLRPFIKQVFNEKALGLLNTLGVPKLLGNDNMKLVANSPLLLAVLLTKEEYVRGDLSELYCLLSLGMAIENIWLTTTSLGMGIQFVSTPMEVPEAWQEINTLLKVPQELELMAIYRLGYLPDEADKVRPRIDWQSKQRRTLARLAFRDTCEQTESVE